MVVLVLGHRGMLGRRVMERFPHAETIEARFAGGQDDPLIREVGRLDPDWVIDCIGRTSEPMWLVNATLPHILARWNLVYPSTDHVDDDTPYARSKKAGEAGHVIRCAIVDPEGGMLRRCRERDTVGQVKREWNGITARMWAWLAQEVVEGRRSGLIVPGSPTISHYELQETARQMFGWPTRTIEGDDVVWKATWPRLLLPPIETQLRSYL